jgi:hypothetical protein
MDVLDKAEAADSYRERCAKSFLNDLARNGQGYELSSISKEALDSLRRVVADIPLLDSCEIAILNSKADNGFPHTRPSNLICLPDFMCKEEASPKFIETLIHEAIHVHQRLNKTLWETGLRKLNWTPVAPEKIPEKFKEKIRLNPDTLLEPFWAWSTYHVPLPLFNKFGPTSLSNTRVEWLDLRTGSLFHDPPTGFEKVYTEHIHQMEHPYEIYAELFAARGLKTPEAIAAAL